MGLAIFATHLGGVSSGAGLVLTCLVGLIFDNRVVLGLFEGAHGRVKLRRAGKLHTIHWRTEQQAHRLHRVTLGRQGLASRSMKLRAIECYTVYAQKNKGRISVE